MRIKYCILVSLTAGLVSSAHSCVAQITVEELVSSWKDHAIPKVSCRIESKVHRWDAAARTNATSDIFTNSVVDGPPVVDELEGFVYRISGVGTRARFDGIECNILEAVATDVYQDGVNPSSTYSVNINNASEAFVTKHSNSDVFLNWLEPAESDAAKALIRIPTFDINVIEDSISGPIASVIIDNGRGGSTKVQLAEKFGWRIVSNIEIANGKPVSKAFFKYATNAKGVSVLVSWEKISFLKGSPWRMERTSVTEVVLDCKTSDLVVKIPNNSVVRDTRGAAVERYLVRPDGTKRGLTMEEVANANSMQELIETDEGDLLPTGRVTSLATFWGFTALLAAILIAWRIVARARLAYRQ